MSLPPGGATHVTARGPDEMGREMARGPEAVAATLAATERLRPELAATIGASRRVVLLGTGASLAIIRTAAPLWRTRLQGVEVVVREAIDVALGGLDGYALAPSDVLVAVSQSGSSPETVAAARAARGAGAQVLAVTGNADSPLAAAAAVVVPVAGGTEHGASTRSELAGLAALLAVGGVLPSHRDAASDLAGRLRAVVDSWEIVATAGEDLARARRTWFLGFGPALGVAAAAVLLWHEKVIRPTVAVTPTEFRHGLIEAAGSGDAVVLVNLDRGSSGAVERYLDRLRSELAELGVTLVEVTSSPSGASKTGRRLSIRLDDGTPPVQALESLLRVQQLARAAALAAGTYRDGFAILRRLVQPATELIV